MTLRETTARALCAADAAERGWPEQAAWNNWRPRWYRMADAVLAAQTAHDNEPGVMPDVEIKLIGRSSMYGEHAVLEHWSNYANLPAGTHRLYLRPSADLAAKLDDAPGWLQHRYSKVHPSVKTTAVRVLEEVCEFATEMTEKYGSPIGTQYEEGQQDMGVRIVQHLRARIELEHA